MFIPAFALDGGEIVIRIQWTCILTNIIVHNAERLIRRFKDENNF